MSSFIVIVKHRCAFTLSAFQIGIQSLDKKQKLRWVDF